MKPLRKIDFPKGKPVLFITRDSTRTRTGKLKLLPHADLWVARPHPRRNDDDTIEWVARYADEDAWLGHITLELSEDIAGTFPQDDLDRVVVEATHLN